MPITQTLLKELLRYDSDSGVFIWLVNMGKLRTAGKIAGTVTDQGYITITIGGKKLKAHRLAWLYVHGVMPKQIDHVDRNPLNNRLSNLRLATYQQNSANAKWRSAYKGVRRNKGGNRWEARIKVDQHEYFLGSYTTEEEAAKRYNEAARHYFGEYAFLNPV